MEGILPTGAVQNLRIIHSLDIHGACNKLKPSLRLMQAQKNRASCFGAFIPMPLPREIVSAFSTSGWVGGDKREK